MSVQRSEIAQKAVENWNNYIDGKHLNAPKVQPAASSAKDLLSKISGFEVVKDLNYEEWGDGGLATESLDGSARLRINQLYSR